MSLESTLERAPAASHPDPGARSVLVIGAGITGLAAAHHVMERAAARGERVAVRVLDAASRAGGQIRTERVDGFLLEGGPDTLVLSKPSGTDLCARLGMEEDVVPLAAPGRGAGVLRGGRLHDVPRGLGIRSGAAILPGSLLSLPGRLRMALEPLVPPRRDEQDESLGSFVTRRFGREALERLWEPVVASLFTADADRLSLGAVLPHLHEAERRHGSLAAAARARVRSGAPDGTGGHASSRRAGYLRHGFASLVEQLESRLPSGALSTGARVEEITPAPDGKGFAVRVAGEPAQRAGAVILACPAGPAAAMLARSFPELAEDIAPLPYASCATVSLAYRQGDVSRPPSIPGFFVPRTEPCSLLACSFASVKFPERAPAGTMLVRAFLGGALNRQVLEQDDAALAREAHQALRPLLGNRGEPILRRVHRFPDAMPQFEVGFPARLARIRRHEEARNGLHLAGSAVGAVGLPDCIASGEAAARAALDAPATSADRCGGAREPSPSFP